MRRIRFGLTAIAALVPAVVGGAAFAIQNKDTVQVPGGLALTECRGYETWQPVAVSHAGSKLNVIVANSTMIAAYQAGIPGNGQKFPDGAKTMKIAWLADENPAAPFPVSVPGALSGLGCMVKDSRRFADSGGWGYAQFDYVAASDTLAPNTAMQKNDAKCGAECHTIAAARDYVFTVYGKR
jgi:hypothetical protein